MWGWWLSHPFESPLCCPSTWTVLGTWSSPILRPLQACAKPGFAPEWTPQLRGRNHGLPPQILRSPQLPWQRPLPAGPSQWEAAKVTAKGEHSVSCLEPWLSEARSGSLCCLWPAACVLRAQGLPVLPRLAPPGPHLLPACSLLGSGHTGLEFFLGLQPPTSLFLLLGL